MTDADLIVIGAGLSGCALVARLRQLGWEGQIALVDAAHRDAEGIERPGASTMELQDCISASRLWPS